MLARLVLLAQKLPPWVRPAFFGASALFTIVGLRMLFALPLILTQHKGGEFALGLLVAACAGAAGGFGYTLIGAPSRRIPLVGPYVAGVITVSAYMLALLLAAPYISAEPLVRDRTSAIIFAVVTVFFGLIFGHLAFRDSVFDGSVFGILFLACAGFLGYFGVRGLWLYLHGSRAAPADPLAFTIGIGACLGLLYLTVRLWWRRASQDYLVPNVFLLLGSVAGLAGMVWMMNLNLELNRSALSEPQIVIVPGVVGVLGLSLWWRRVHGQDDRG